MAEAIPQYVKDVYVFLGKTDKQAQRMMLYLLKNPAEWLTCDELVEKIITPRIYAFRKLVDFKEFGLLEQEYRTKPRDGGGWSRIQTWRIKQDLDKDFASLLKEELEIKLQNMEI